MNFKRAKNICKVRGYIARLNGYHANIPKHTKFWKNHQIPLNQRVSIEDQQENDWNDFDPEGEATSITG